MITVLYDGKCGLCAKEINYYRTIAPANVFDWQDITQSNHALDRAGISLAQGLKLLHVIDQQDKIHIGVDAFIIMWRQLRYWKILAFFTNLPLIRQLAQLVYRVFAHYRFKHNAHCQLATAAPQPKHRSSDDKAAS